MKFYNKLRLEGVLKSLIISLIPSLGISLILSLAFYFIEVNLLWISLLSFFIMALILTPALYYIFYRVDEASVARRVDLEGLEERLITMVESKDDDSLMAKYQREDALRHLEEVKSKKIKLKLKKIPLVIMSTLLAISVIIQTLISLSMFGYFPSFNQIAHPESMIISVKYIYDTGGQILGESIQKIKKGEGTKEVLALADDGYIFVGWSDGLNNPARIDKELYSDLEIKAIFKELDLDLANGSIADNDLPDSSSSGSGDMDGSMDGSMPGASGEYIESNQVIDGNTYYRDVYEKYLKEALDLLNKGKEIPEWLRLLVEEYFNVIK